METRVPAVKTFPRAGRRWIVNESSVARIVRGRNPWRLLGAAAALLLGTLFVQTLLQAAVVVTAQRLAGLGTTTPPVIVALLLAGQATFLLVGAAVARRYLDGLPLDRLSRADAVWLGGGLLVKFALFGLSQLAIDGLSLQEPPDLLGQAVAATPWLLVVLAALSVLLVGPAEETFFRGALQGTLRRGFGPVAAVLGAAALFAAPHALNYVVGGTDPLAPGSLVSLATVFATGAVMGWAYERTDNLAVPVLMHGLYDATIFLAVFAFGLQV